MNPLWILLVGVVIVVGGILVLRLHAFLALVLAALTVSALTPGIWVERYAIEGAGSPVLVADNQESGPTEPDRKRADDARLIEVEGGAKQGFSPGTQLFVMRPDSQTHGMRQVAELRVVRLMEGKNRSGRTLPIALAEQVAATDGDAGPYAPTAGDVAISGSDLRRAEQQGTTTIGERVAGGFGNTCAAIGILIAMAAIIGKCLLDSGAADRIVRSALRVMGERGAPIAFLGSGFLLAIPVFFDTVFYLMIPLGKALRAFTGRNYLLYVLTIVAGGTMAHSLVPPTPGPLFVAEELNVDIGLMIIAGCIVGCFTSAAGYLFALWANRRWELPLRESPEFSFEDLEAISHRRDEDLPPLGFSLLPILLPVLLIGGYTVVKSPAIKPSFVAALAGMNIEAAPVLDVMASLGNKNLALVISAALAIALLVWQKRTSLKELGGSLQAALASGGVIILITASGGAFGKAVQQTGVARLVEQLPTGSPLVVLTLAFVITAAVRTAQGSATVAMITAVGILAGLASAEQLGFHPVYVALAIGCGSKPLAWMNDSGFWVICKMSGMNEAEGLKYITPLSLLMGIVGLIVTLVGAQLFPLV